MEFSSPLAAMQPPPRPWGGFGRDITNIRPRHSNTGSFGGSNFNFRDLSMKKSQPDYFSLKSGPARGSSPTASLAADLSQNFHIDQSPQLATPRRSLFTTRILTSRFDREGATTPPIISWEGVTTPPIPSSSPAYAGDSMDISPLPHKVPFSFAQGIKAHSPSPVPTPDEDMISPCDAQSNNQLQVPQERPLERKRSTFLRPSFTRSRFSSSSSINHKPENQLPKFTFGAGGNGLSSSASITSLDECFKASPPQERNPFDSSLGGPARPRQLFANNNASARSNLGGSPINVSVKRSVTSMPRPRKQFRRSLSMFEHPGDVMKQEKAYVPSGLQSIMDVDEVPGMRLPHFFPDSDHPEHGSLPRVNSDTMIGVLNGNFSHHYDRTLIVDCRFEYEYEGGHIQGALNYNDKEQLAQQLFAEAQSNTLIIFHCEYSNHRAPLMAAYIRKHDRSVNAANYPRLSYPEAYILDGGYCSFFQSHRSLCFPQNYVLMNDEAHESACERGLGKIKQRQKLSRAQTFAFGQSCQMEDSPSRSTSCDTGLPIGMDITPGQMLSRRMASY